MYDKRGGGAGGGGGGDAASAAFANALATQTTHAMLKTTTIITDTKPSALARASARANSPVMANLALCLAIECAVARR